MRIDRVTWTSVAVASVLVAATVGVAAVRGGAGGVGGEAGDRGPGAAATAGDAGAGAADEGEAARAAGSAAEALALGAEVWAAECAACHGEGEDVAPAAAALAAAAGGREALIDFLLDGRARRPGEPPGRRRHPPFAELSDREIAAVLDHFLAAGGGAHRPADVAARRALVER